MFSLKPASILAALMLAEKAWRHVVVMRFFRRTTDDRQPTTANGGGSAVGRPSSVVQPVVPLVSILQPILSGDPTMPTCLERNLAMETSYPLEFIWLVDTNDAEADRVCRDLMARYPHRRVLLHAMPPPGERDNPKMVKLIEGVRLAQGDIICVLDDDTQLPDKGLEQCLPYLDLPDVGLAFGLPYYVSFDNVWSSLVSYFVDSHSLLTYVPYTALTEPFTINGMFYAMKREVLNMVGGFEGLQNTLADDFAVARRFREHGLRLAQTPLLHGISTHVTGPRHYLSLIQRWFIFPRESLMRHLGVRDQAVLYFGGIVPALYPLALLLSIARRPTRSKVAYTLVYFAYSYAIFAQINKAYLRSAAPWGKSWLVPVIQACFPLQLLVALLSPKRIVWRGHVMQVERGGGFRFVERRGTHTTDANDRSSGHGEHGG